MGCSMKSRRENLGAGILRFVAALFFGLAATIQAQPTNAPIDWDKARVLGHRYERGEHLTDDELALLQASRDERARRLGEGAPPVTDIFTNRNRSLISLIPLTVLAQGETYKGADGGLYGQGRNTPPPELEAAMRKALGTVAPRDIDGRPDKSGLIVLLSIGMSNTTQEFERFKELAEGDRAKSDALIIVDGAQSGCDAGTWDPANPESFEIWRELERRLKMSGVTAPQVQVLWLKQARQQPALYGEFPGHVDELKEHLIAILQEARRRFPNLQIAYLSSRTYAGYAKTTLSPEPYAYESAFAVRGVILDQMRGDKKLNLDPEQGPIRAPVVMWGPYLWTDGAKAREDGLTWLPRDVERDGVHPSASGRDKVAHLLLDFFKTNPLAMPWFTGRGLDLQPAESIQPHKPVSPEAL